MIFLVECNNIQHNLSVVRKFPRIQVKTSKLLVIKMLLNARLNVILYYEFFQWLERNSIRITVILLIESIFSEKNIFTDF